MEYRTFFRKNSSGKLRYFTACVVRNKKKKLSSSTESNWESETIEKLKKTKSYEKYKDGGNLVFGIGEEKSNINDARVSCVSDARQKCKSKYKKFSFFAWEKEYGESKNTGYYTCIVLAECVPTD